MAGHRKARGLASNCWCCKQGVTTGVGWASNPAIRKPNKANKGCPHCGSPTCLGQCVSFNGGCGHDHEHGHDHDHH